MSQIRGLGKAQAEYDLEEEPDGNDDREDRQEMLDAWRMQCADVAEGR